MLARRQSTPTLKHLLGAERILIYLLGHPFGIRYHKGTSQVNIRALCDATWGSDLETRRSQTGYLVYFNDSLVDWYSGLQKCVSLSSAEAELISASKAAQAVQWILKLERIGASNHEPAEIYCDNKSTIAIVENPLAFSRTKHIAIRYFYCRDLVNTGQVHIKYIPTRSNTADALTKILPQDLFLFHVESMITEVLAPRI